MTSTFRLTRAEFKKIFKRPSVFIMAIMIVATIFVSLGIFNPVSLGDDDVVYDNYTDSAGYYNQFMTIDADDTKIGFDKQFLASDNTILYYNLVQNRVISISDDYQKVVQTLNNIRSSTNSSLDADYTAFENAVNKFSNSLYDFSTFATLKEYSSDQTINPYYYHIDYLESLYQEPVVAGKSYDTFRTEYTADSDKLITEIAYYKTRNKRLIVDAYDTNEYEAKLKIELDNAINFISTTINYLSFKLTDTRQLLDSFNKTASGSGANSSRFKDINTDLNKTLNDLNIYIEKALTNKELQLIYQKDTDNKNLTNALEFAIECTSAENTNGASFSKYQQINEELLGYRLTSKINTGTSTITQVEISKSTINELNKSKTKVLENKENILDKINELKTDEAIKNIQKNITFYKLLAASYKNYVHAMLLSDVTRDMDKSQFSKLSNIEYQEFNRYQNNEKIVLNTYYMQHPKTYETHELANGQPVAVVSNGPVACRGPECRTMPVPPLPPSKPQIVPYSTTETTTVETKCTKKYQTQEASVITTEVLPTPAPVIVTQTETVAPVPAVEPDPDPTWWETYQAEKKPEPVSAQPVCPCPDPNDPCPQCFDK